MPCYLFTYHAYGSWMPDHERGYTVRGEGVKPTDEARGGAWRSRQNDHAAWFDESKQGLLVEVCRGAGDHIDATVHCVFTEPTHVHVMVSWHHDREWKSMRSSIKSAMSRKLNEEHGRRTWFADSASRKKVADESHFLHLLGDYRKKHAGAQWINPKDAKRLKNP